MKTTKTSTYADVLDVTMKRLSKTIEEQIKASSAFYKGDAFNKAWNEAYATVQQEEKAKKQANSIKLLSEMESSTNYVWSSRNVRGVWREPESAPAPPMKVEEIAQERKFNL